MTEPTRQHPPWRTCHQGKALPGSDRALRQLREQVLAAEDRSAGGVISGGLPANPVPGMTCSYVPALPLGHPAVVTVLTGARSPGEGNEYMDLMRHPIPADLQAESTTS